MVLVKQNLTKPNSGGLNILCLPDFWLGELSDIWGKRFSFFFALNLGVQSGPADFTILYVYHDVDDLAACSTSCKCSFSIKFVWLCV